jgi:hypothetical protein
MFFIIPIFVIRSIGTVTMNFDDPSGEHFLPTFKSSPYLVTKFQRRFWCEPTQVLVLHHFHVGTLLDLYIKEFSVVVFFAVVVNLSYSAAVVEIIVVESLDYFANLVGYPTSDALWINGFVDNFIFVDYIKEIVVWSRPMYRSMVPFP